MKVKITSIILLLTLCGCATTPLSENEKAAPKQETSATPKEVSNNLMDNPPSTSYEHSQRPQ